MEKTLSKEWGWLLAAAGFPAAVYLYSLGNSFAFDDKHIIASNRFLDDFANIRLIFSRRYFELTSELSYRPVVTLSYFFDRALWGLSPFGYHLTNLAFHVGTALIFFRFLLWLTCSRPWSILSSLAFSIHPALSEAVLSPGFRDDLISGFFFVLTLALFFCPLGTSNCSSKGLRPRRLFLALSSSSFFVALFSKESAAALLPLLIAIDWVRGKGGFAVLRRRLISAYPYFAAVLTFYLSTRFIFMHNPLESKLIYAAGGFSSALYTAPRLIFFYLITFFLPARLRVDYDFRQSGSPLDPAVLIAALVLASIALLIYRFRRVLGNHLIGALWFFFALLPVLGLLPIANLVADRFLYLPAMGFSIAYSSALLKLAAGEATIAGAGLSRKIGLVLLAAVLFFFSALTVKRSIVWRDDVSLWADAALKSPTRTRPLLNLGTALMEKGQVDKATGSYLMAIAIKPEADSYTNLGSAFKKKNLIDKAQWAYGQALVITPGYFEALYNLGLLRLDRADYWGASEHFLHAANARPRDAETRADLGASFSKAGLKDKGAAEYEAALSIDPLHVKALSNLAEFYLSKGIFHQGASIYKRLIALDNSNSMAQLNLGVAYQRLGLSDRAAAQFLLALGLRVDFEALFDLGVVYSQKKFHSGAIKFYSKALKIKPGHIDATFNLGASHQALGRKDKARLIYSEVLRVRPSFRPALDNLAMINRP